MRPACFLIIPACMGALAANPILTRDHFEQTPFFKSLSLEEVPPPAAPGAGAAIVAYRPARASGFAGYPLWVEIRTATGDPAGPPIAHHVAHHLTLFFPKQEPGSGTVAPRNRFRVFADFLDLASLTADQETAARTAIAKAESGDRVVEFVPLQGDASILVRGTAKLTVVTIGGN